MPRLAERHIDVLEMRLQFAPHPAACRTASMARHRIVRITRLLLEGHQLVAVAERNAGLEEQHLLRAARHIRKRDRRAGEMVEDAVAINDVYLDRMLRWGIQIELTIIALWAFLMLTL